LTRSRARALASAIRVARAATGRKGVLVVRGSVAEQVVCAADAGFALFEAKRAARGGKSHDEAHTFVVECADADALECMLTEHCATLAAVVIEPFAVSTGLCAPPEGHLARLRALCSEHSVLLVFDDSVSALRVGPGGAEGAIGVAPDLTCFGTEFGAGLPLAVLGGRKEFMKKAGRSARLSSVGDAPSDDLAVSAGIAVLEALNEPGFYDALNEHAVRLADGFGTACRAAGRSLDIRRVGSLVGAVSTSANEKDAPCGNAAVTPWENFVDGLLAAGIIPPCDPLMPWAVSAAHSKEDIDRAIEVFGGAMNANHA